MAKYGSDDVTISIDNAGGTLTDITAHVTAIGGIKIEALTEETTPFGVANPTHAGTGMVEWAEFDLEGFYDDAASPAPDALFGGGLGATRTFEIGWGGSKTTSVEVIIKKYVRTATVRELHKYVATVLPTGAITEV